MFVDAICYHGPRQAFNFQQVPRVELAVGIEILPASQASTEIAPRFGESKPGGVEAIWRAAEGLRVAVPVPRVK